MATAALKRVRHWGAGFLGRLWYVAQFAAFIPCVVLGMLLAPLYWLITGRHMPVPEWMERMDRR